MTFVSDVTTPSTRLLEGIRSKINANGNQSKVIVELDKLSYVEGVRRKYDAVKFVADSVVSEILSIDSAQKITDYVTGTEVFIPTELVNAPMSMPIRSSSTMNGKVTNDNFIQGMRITDWFETDRRCSRKEHKGMDFDLAIGDPLYAIWAGTVAFAGKANGYGNVVYINHGNGWQTRYAHMDKIGVNAGDKVSVGSLIGTGGNSGTVQSSGGGDGSHLHFEIRKDDKPLNPDQFLRGDKTLQSPTKSVPSSDNRGYVDYTVEATAYVATCKGCIGITKGGTNVREWKNWKIIAVDPSVIPLGSIVELIVDGASWGDYKADDTGGAIKGNKIDILMETTKKAFDFGRRSITARVKEWGDGKSRTSTGEGNSVSIHKEITTYKVNKTTTKQTFHQDFHKNATLPSSRYTTQNGIAKFFVADDDSKRNVIGFNGTAAAGVPKTLIFEHEWFKSGVVNWAYYADLEADDIVTVKVAGYTLATIKGINAKNGIAYPPSLPVPPGKHEVEFSFANSSKASRGKFGLLYLKVKEFDVESVEQKQIWDFEDNMDTTNKWTSYGAVAKKDMGSYQSISTKGGEAGIERLSKIKKFPFTIHFSVKSVANTSGKLVIGDGKKAFLLNIEDDGISARGGGHYSIDTTKDFIEFIVTCHDDTDMDVYMKSVNSLGLETWINTGVRGVAFDYNYVSRILFSVTTGTLFLDQIKYASNDYAIEQFASHIANSYSDKWYEVGDFVFDETFTIENDIINWEVYSHMDSIQATATITLDNSSGIYSSNWIRSPEFPETYKRPESPMSYYEGNELVHVISEGTPVRIYAGYGDDIVRVFTGMIKGEITENSQARTISFRCVDMFDLVEEFVFYKPMNYPPEEAFNGDGGAYAWLKSSIVEDIIVESGLTQWKVNREDLLRPDYIIDNTVYIDVNKGENTYMRMNQETGLFEAVKHEEKKMVGGWENPFVASVSYPVGTRASDAISTLLQDIPYDYRCDRYGTFLFQRLDFLDYPDWRIHQGTKWEFIDGENLTSLNSSTDYSGVRNHLMISGSTGLVEHFFDKSLMIATKGKVRTAGIQQVWLDEENGNSMRGAKETIASKVFFDIKRQARTKNVEIKGNPLIELLDAVYVYDSKTFTANHYIVKGNRLSGSKQGMVNHLELTWETIT